MAGFVLSWLSCQLLSEVEVRRLYEKFIHNVRLHKLLVKFDHDLARAARAQGCPCGGKLHSAHYARKPRGVPADVREFYCERLSLCCAEDNYLAKPPALPERIEAVLQLRE